MYVTDPLGIFPHAIKSMASTMFACDAPFVYASDTRVFYMSSLFSAIVKVETGRA